MGQMLHAGRFDGMTATPLPPTADTATDVNVDLSVLDSLDFAIPCDMTPTTDQPEHDAEVYATFSCGHGAFFCAPHATLAQEALMRGARLAAILGTSLSECSECGAPDPLIVMIQPIADSKADSGRSDRSGRAA